MSPQTITLITASTILMLVCIVLVRRTTYAPLAKELFVDSTPTEEEALSFKAVYGNLARLPIHMKDRVWTPFNDVVKGMTGGVSAEGDEQPVDVSDMVGIAKNKRFFEKDGVFGTDGSLDTTKVDALEKDYKDLNYALSKIKEHKGGREFFMALKQHVATKVPGALDIQRTNNEDEKKNA